MTCRARKFTFAGFGTTCLFALVLASENFSYGDVVYNLPQILEVLVKPLDAVGIDVLIGEINPNDIRSRPKRARLALLGSLGISDPIPAAVLRSEEFAAVLRSQFGAWSQSQAAPWSQSETGKEFEAGNLGVIAVFLRKVKRSSWFSWFSFLFSSVQNEKQVQDENKFSLQWDESEGTRVFLAFRREDAEWAKEAAKAIENEGYTVFIYLNEPGKPPRFSAEYTSKVLFEADYHLFIETPRSFASGGGNVFWERLALDIAHGKEALKRFEDELFKPKRPPEGPRASESPRASGGPRSLEEVFGLCEPPDCPERHNNSEERNKPRDRRDDPNKEILKKGD
jgi:hypothetical protein